MFSYEQPLPELLPVAWKAQYHVGVTGDKGGINKCEVGNMICDVIGSRQMVLARTMLSDAHNSFKMKASKICSLFSLCVDTIERTTSKTSSS